MDVCECSNKIEDLRKKLIHAFELARSFTDKSVIDISEALDKSLILYENCNCRKNFAESMGISKTKKNDIQLALKEKMIQVITARQSRIFSDLSKTKSY
ncbi:aspartyl-phosphate phosphatase Spo0E family protein [Paenibacillus sp. IITD108]|uniref:aspartyl-phosphate phosphatase Spo0E family protein n=1 Tax=Paenibacillus sp. IITD108 TaxID=3116649 RepID=UPI002F3EC48E